MFQLLLGFVYLGIVTAFRNQGASGCSIPNTAFRSSWNILEGCFLTLLLCVWQAVHPDVLKGPWCKRTWQKVVLALKCFFLPEWMVYVACTEWWTARKDNEKAQKHFDDITKPEEYAKKWTITHSFFAAMGGFQIFNGPNTDPSEVKSFKDYRKHSGRIIKDITKKEIKDKSKSDTLGKIILSVQLIWFIVQAGVRYFGGRHLMVTLVELDTVCMCVLTISLLFFWWDKPLRVGSPLFFYTKPDASGNQPSAQSTDNSTQSTDKSSREIGVVALCITWIIFGGLHMAAWHYPFATKYEAVVWHIASFVLAAAPSCIIVAWFLTRRCFNFIGEPIRRAALYFALALAFLARIILIVLMIASLRSLPCSAYETIPWISYMPHFS